MLRCSNFHNDDKFHGSWHSSLSIVNLDQLLYFGSRLNGLDKWCPRMIQLCLSMQIHNCYQSLRLRIPRSSSTSSFSSIKNSSSGRSGSNGSNFALLLFLWTSNYASRQGSRFPGHVFFHKGGSGKTKLNVCKVRSDDYLFAFQTKRISSQHEKIITFCHTFLGHAVNVQSRSKGTLMKRKFLRKYLTEKKGRNATTKYWFLFLTVCIKVNESGCKHCRVITHCWIYWIRYWEKVNIDIINWEKHRSTDCT